MTSPRIRRTVTLALLAGIVVAACGSSSERPQATATIGPAGGTLTAGSSALTIPPNALATSTQVTIREAEPRHSGRVLRVELEPAGLALASPARVAIRVDDANARVRIRGSDDSLRSVELEDRNHGSYKTSLSALEAIEVELEHGASCSPACSAGQECDDGACKPHVEDAAAATCPLICDSGMECDDGACKPHGGVSGSGAAVACVPSCATGLECDNGVCKVHHSGGA